MCGKKSKSVGSCLHSCFLSLESPTAVFFHLVVLPLTEKRYAKKRLSQEQAKDDAGQQPEAADTDGPPVLEESLSRPPKVPLIEPKSEPEEQESKWKNSLTHSFL